MTPKGRPRVLPTTAKRRSIFIDDELWGEVAEAAKADDRSMSAWIRKVLKNATNF